MDSAREEIALLWRDLFQIDTITPDANFFELGGDSVLAMMLSFSVAERFSIDVPPELLFEASTLDGFSDQIIKLQTAGAV